MRAYPDVAALASGVPLVAGGATFVTGGTSASTPAFAGIVSLLNALRLNKGFPALGFLQPRLYQAAAEASAASVLIISLLPAIITTFCFPFR
jgi:tripeptidyl-peptidase-1